MYDIMRDEMWDHDEWTDGWMYGQTDAANFYVGDMVVG